MPDGHNRQVRTYDIIRDNKESHQAFGSTELEETQSHKPEPLPGSFLAARSEAASFQPLRGGL